MTITTTKRFTIAEYHRLAELGFFSEDERVELIRGEIIQIVAKGTPHGVCETRLERELFKLVGNEQHCEDNNLLLSLMTANPNQI